MHFTQKKEKRNVNEFSHVVLRQIKRLKVWWWWWFTKQGQACSVTVAPLITEISVWSHSLEGLKESVSETGHTSAAPETHPVKAFFFQSCKYNLMEGKACRRCRFTSCTHCFLYYVYYRSA